MKNNALRPRSFIQATIVIASALVELTCSATAADPRVALEKLGGSCVENASGQVVTLDLSRSWLTDADLKWASALPHLESINLAYTKVSDLGLEHLAPLKNVKRLNLYFAESVSDLGIAHLKHWQHLEFLNLRGTKVTSTVFEHASRFTELRFLDVGFSRVNDDSFELLDSLPNLEHLAFGGNKMSGVCLPLLKALPALKSLSLAGQQRTDSGLWSVALTDFNVTHVAALQHLESLDVSETNLADRGLAEIARLTNLHSLNLSKTRVTSQGLSSLARLPHLRRLKLWKVDAVDDSAIDHLLAMSALETLEISETSVSYAGLSRLTLHKGLSRLYIGGVTLTSAQLEDLRKSLPGCEISWWVKPSIEYPEAPRR